MGGGTLKATVSHTRLVSRILFVVCCMGSTGLGAHSGVRVARRTPADCTGNSLISVGSSILARPIRHQRYPDHRKPSTIAFVRQSLNEPDVCVHVHIYVNLYIYIYLR